MAKLTTRGFFRGLISHALTGKGENPLNTIAKGILGNGKTEVETSGEEAPSQEDRADELQAGSTEAGSSKAHTKV